MRRGNEIRVRCSGVGGVFEVRRGVNWLPLRCPRNKDRICDASCPFVNFYLSPTCDNILDVSTCSPEPMYMEDEDIKQCGYIDAGVLTEYIRTSIGRQTQVDKGSA